MVTEQSEVATPQYLTLVIVLVKTTVGLSPGLYVNPFVLVVRADFSEFSATITSSFSAANTLAGTHANITANERIKVTNVLYIS